MQKKKGHTFALLGEAEYRKYVGFLHSMMPFYEFIGSLNFFKDSKTIVYVSVKLLSAMPSDSEVQKCFLRIGPFPVAEPDGPNFIYFVAYKNERVISG